MENRDDGDRSVPDAHDIARTEAFRTLVRERTRFSVPVAALGFGAYLLIIVLSGFTTVLSGGAIGALSWTAVLTALIFPLVWVLCHLYRRRAQRWDALAERAAAEAQERGVRA